MKRSIEQAYSLFLSVIFFILVMGWPFTGFAESADMQNLPGPGHTLGPFSLPVPKNLTSASYLGLEKGSRFNPTELRADLWLIEVFNVYCASCQFMRPYMNELFARVQTDPDMKGRVKMIAVGAGNHQWDIEDAEKGYSFPIVPDEDYVFHKLVGQPPTPFLIFARPYTQDKMVVVASHLGRLEDSAVLFAMVREALSRDISKLSIKPFQGIGGNLAASQEPTMPMTESQLMLKINESMTIDGKPARDIESIPLPGWDRVYTAKLLESNRRIFARVVARKIPCIDCHDVFYVYSFDADGRFLRFVPISISKYGNRQWDDADIAKIQNRFKDESLLNPVPYYSKVDAITSATISTELVYDGIGDTRLIIDALRQKGYIPTANRR